MSNLVQEYNDLLMLLTKYNIYLKNLSDDLLTPADVQLKNLEDLYTHPDKYLYPLLIENMNSLLLIYTLENGNSLKYLAKIHLDNFNAQSSLYYTRTDTAYYHQITSQRTNNTVLTISGQIAQVFNPGLAHEIPLKFPNMKTTLENDLALKDFQTNICQTLLDTFTKSGGSTSNQSLISIPELTAEITNSTNTTLDVPDGIAYGVALLSPMLLPLWGQIIRFNYYPNKYSVELTHLEIALMLYYPSEDE